jgi:anthranilate synthase component 2
MQRSLHSHGHLDIIQEKADPMRILIIDNYDSFTYNLVHLVEKITENQVDVVFNDQFQVEDLLTYDRLILSPGPGLPDDAGKLKEAISFCKDKRPILGVCLGHQAIGEVFGARLKNLETVYHGISSNLELTETIDPIYKNIPATILAGRYHSWVIDPETLPECLDITSLDDNGNIMSIRHKWLNITGVQYHPESILTPFGEKIVSNWIYS